MSNVYVQRGAVGGPLENFYSICTLQFDEAQEENPAAQAGVSPGVGVSWLAKTAHGCVTGGSVVALERKASRVNQPEVVSLHNLGTGGGPM